MNPGWESVIDFTVFLGLLPASQLLALIGVRHVKLKKRHWYLPLFALFYVGAALMCLKVFLLGENRDWGYLKIVSGHTSASIGAGCLTGLLIVPLLVGMYHILRQIGVPLHGTFQSVRELMGTTSRELAAFLFTAVVAGGILEEVLFRGYLITRLAETLPKYGAVLISSLAFALFHLPVLKWIGLLNALLSGFILGCLFLWDGNLTAPVAAHCTVNVCMAFLMYFRWIGAEEFRAIESKKNQTFGAGGSFSSGKG